MELEDPALAAFSGEVVMLTDRGFSGRKPPMLRVLRRDCRNEVDP